MIFNENVNFINTKSNIKFEKAIEQIETLYIEKKTEYDDQAEEDREGKEEPKKYKIANEFRDSFRTIKSALIKDNNMLDASNYHRIELYCKELELEYRREEKVEGSGIRDIVDRIQLYCYRLTSDHHTDLLLILNNVIIIIALFSAMSFAINHFDMHSLEIEQSVGAFVACLIFIILTIFLTLAYEKLTVFSSVSINHIQTFFHEKRGIKKCFRFCVVFFSYIVITITLVTKPTSLVPIFGKLIDGSSGINSTISMSLSIVYTIFIFLFIWSLQKTARKNTIILR